MTTDRIKASDEQALDPEVCGIPENRLMLAVLHEALSTFRLGLQSNVPRRRRLAVEVEQWVLDDNHDWPFSFVTICETLRLDADYIRRGMRQMKQMANAGCTETSLGVRREGVQGRRMWRGRIG